jgi:hypothetical protein
MSALAQVYSKAWVRAINSLISAAVQLSPRGSVKCKPLSVSTVWILWGGDYDEPEKCARRCALHSRSASASRRAFRVSSTLPRTTPVEVILDPLVVDRDDIVQRTRCSLIHGVSLLRLLWLRLATSSSARFGAASQYLFVRKFCTSSFRPYRSALNVEQMRWARKEKGRVGEIFKTAV